ncbi:nicotinate (nicotinamide) nucleotide adenylyltransferase [Halosquirtibacter xylanolyticus]|uniref:nicotinate (nicotinamide) nucleotide adenylyltransferase n=1 Tax=Halosquirtibacter xylanolyticus TaxID=3374599 RepID=UPI003747B8A9|nr:nicotinate (nicotinamide) nucleotide adenylyltransferase [Prolixibacteraceae bacterium]
MNIVLFSGSFSPVHNGHVYLVKELLKDKEVDQVWLSVTPLNPLKEASDVWPIAFRKSLIRKVFESMPNVILTEIEESLPSPLYTIHTLYALKEKYKEYTFSLLVGEDNYRNITKWYSYKELLENFSLYVFPREDDHDVVHQKSVDIPNVKWLKSPMIDVSSTEIRNKAKNHEPIGNLVPYCIEEDIVNYISM